MKVCSKCKQEKDLEEFAPNKTRKLGRASWCKVCVRDRWNNNSGVHSVARKTKYADDTEFRKRVAEASKRYREAHKESLAARHRDKHREMKTRIFAKYGGKCKCCSENKYEFLVIDHVNGGGNKERKSMPPAKLFRMLDVTPEPLPQYRLLCHNCNSALGHYGFCPHQTLSA